MTVSNTRRALQRLAPSGATFTAATFTTPPPASYQDPNALAAANKQYPPDAQSVNTRLSRRSSSTSGHGALPAFRRGLQTSRCPTYEVDFAKKADERPFTTHLHPGRGVRSHKRTDRYQRPGSMQASHLPASPLGKSRTSLRKIVQGQKGMASSFTSITRTTGRRHDTLHQYPSPCFLGLERQIAA